MAGREFYNTVIEIRGRIEKSLPDILIIKFRIFLVQFLSIGVEGYQFDDPTNRQTHVAYARLAIHTSWLNGDAIQLHFLMPPSLTL